MLKRIADVASLWELLALAATVLIGGAGLGFVGFEWFTHFANHGQYVASAILVLVGLAILGFALLRVPLALFLLFGGAVLVGTSYFVGAVNVLLP